MSNQTTVLAQGGRGIPWQGDDSWDGEHGSGGGKGDNICWMIFAAAVAFVFIKKMLKQAWDNADGYTETDDD